MYYWKMFLRIASKKPTKALGENSITYIKQAPVQTTGWKCFQGLMLVCSPEVEQDTLFGGKINTKQQNEVVLAHTFRVFHGGTTSRRKGCGKVWIATWKILALSMKHFSDFGIKNASRKLNSIPGQVTAVTIISYLRILRSSHVPEHQAYEGPLALGPKGQDIDTSESKQLSLAYCVHIVAFLSEVTAASRIYTALAICLLFVVAWSNPKAMAPAVFFSAYLTLGKGQSLSCRDLYSDIQLSPTKLCALAHSDQRAFASPQADGEGSELVIDDPNSAVLGGGQFFHLLLKHLKDHQISIARLKLSGLSWFSVPDVRTWHIVLTSFPSISSLFLDGVKCDELHFLELIRSFPTLNHLRHDENMIRAYESTRSLGVENVESRFASIEDISNRQQETELDFVHVGITTISDRIMLGLFMTRKSPVVLQHLKELIVRDHAKFVCDISFVRLLNMLLELTTSLFDLNLDNFSITQFLPPLNIPNLHWFHFTIRLNCAFQMDQAIFWENQLRMITDTVEIDVESIPIGALSPRDISAWTALDRAICRDEIQLEELFFKFCAPEDDGHKNLDEVYVTWWLENTVDVGLGLKCFRSNKQKRGEGVRRTVFNIYSPSRHKGVSSSAGGIRRSSCLLIQQLPEQNLNKTRQILNQTAILNSFDTPLAKLENSILPLYTSTQILNRRAGNIEKALLKIDELASNQEGIAADEALILRGPQPNQLDAYRDGLQRLNAAIAFKGSESSSLETEAQKGYTDMCDAWCRKCLEGRGKRVLDRADTIDPIAAGLEFGKWSESILDVAVEELNLLEDLSPLSNSQLAYGALMNPSPMLFTFPAQDKTMVRRGTDAQNEANEFKDGLQSLRNVCLRSFTEFLADVKMASMVKGGELGTALANFVVSALSEEKGKAATKERFTRFYDMFDEVIERYRGVVSVLDDDEEGRAELGEEVVKLIIPSLERSSGVYKTLSRRCRNAAAIYISIMSEWYHSAKHFLWLRVFLVLTRATYGGDNTPSSSARTRVLDSYYSHLRPVRGIYYDYFGRISASILPSPTANSPIWEVILTTPSIVMALTFGIQKDMIAFYWNPKRSGNVDKVTCWIKLDVSILEPPSI
ncbi:uncharacterized protein BT62DRAFT_1034465 [Guyanagaster necrorhizus]|uniref:Uncharacterized protein n=1 Tax=Guyanagaster necrorhizus TaxID=856835 RepID=A0A9P7VND7_9AGAR|nr:uncharacterized protein BT62DRAFT_1034465 [Guyanagaster necrorhizus MCA 3950]KAG7443520.1 hypothetical protein BT62DRAFT_1034465 [Guyanagaster necrorhizus MCA 3950]